MNHKKSRNVARVRYKVDYDLHSTCGISRTLVNTNIIDYSDV